MNEVEMKLFNDFCELAMTKLAKLATPEQRAKFVIACDTVAEMLSEVAVFVAEVK